MIDRGSLGRRFSNYSGDCMIFSMDEVDGSNGNYFVALDEQV